MVIIKDYVVLGSTKQKVSVLFEQYCSQNALQNVSSNKIMFYFCLQLTTEDLIQSGSLVC